MTNEGRLKIGSSFLKVASNYLRIGAVGGSVMFLMACEPGNANHQYVLKFQAGTWTLVADSADLLPLSGGIGGIDSPVAGGFGRYLGSSHWVSGGGSADINAWRSDNGGLSWALKASYDNVADSPHGLPVCRDAAGNIWWAEREALDKFVFKKSTDNGDSASVMYTADTDEDSVYHAAAHPTDANIIAFAGLAQDGGSSPTLIFVTTDGGSSWTRHELDPANGTLTDSTALLFDSDGTLLYVTVVMDSNEVLRVYGASSPYTSFGETDLITENITTVYEGPFMASSRNPQFAGMNWPSSGTPHGRVWRRTTGAWTELAEPFAANIRLFGLCYLGTTLYAIGADPSDNDALKVASAANAGSGSITWTDITAAVNAATGDPWSLSALMASAIWEAA